MTYKTTRMHILVSESNKLQAGGQSPVDVRQPPYPMDFDWADEVTWILSVASVEGSPSAWSLGAKFQFCQPHTDGFRYRNPAWFDLQVENLETNVVEGVGWYGGAHVPPVGGEFGIVADQTDTLRLSVKRTMKHHPGGVRVLLDPQFTGGTNPALHVSLTATARG